MTHIAFDTATLQWALIGYLFGSIPFGIILAKIMGLGNLREIGSGNIGATNVLRTGNKTAAALTLILDGAKGAVAVLLARHVVGDDMVQVTALAAFIGHCWPVWLKFRGGKGVATFLGIVLALAWPVGLACCATWLACAAIWRMSSLAALGAAGFSAIWMSLFSYHQFTLLALTLTILIYVRHHENIARIRAGTESKIGKK